MENGALRCAARPPLLAPAAGGWSWDVSVAPLIGGSVLLVCPSLEVLASHVPLGGSVLLARSSSVVRAVHAPVFGSALLLCPSLVVLAVLVSVLDSLLLARFSPVLAALVSLCGSVVRGPLVALTSHVVFGPVCARSSLVVVLVAHGSICGSALPACAPLMVRTVRAVLCAVLARSSLVALATHALVCGAVLRARSSWEALAVLVADLLSALLVRPSVVHSAHALSRGSALLACPSLVVLAAHVSARPGSGLGLPAEGFISASVALVPRAASYKSVSGQDR